MTSNNQGGRSSATVYDVAKHFGVSHRTVRRWLKATDIPYYRIGGVLRFDLEVVDEWALTRTEPAA